jgi:hypothetical protein
MRPPQEEEGALLGVCVGRCECNADSNLKTQYLRLVQSLCKQVTITPNLAVLDGAVNRLLARRPLPVAEGAAAAAAPRGRDCGPCPVAHGHSCLGALLQMSRRDCTLVRWRTYTRASTRRVALHTAKWWGRAGQAPVVWGTGHPRAPHRGRVSAHRQRGNLQVRLPTPTPTNPAAYVAPCASSAWMRARCVGNNTYTGSGWPTWSRACCGAREATTRRCWRGRVWSSMWWPRLCTMVFTAPGSCRVALTCFASSSAFHRSCTAACWPLYPTPRCVWPVLARLHIHTEREREGDTTDHSLVHTCALDALTLLCVRACGCLGGAPV